MAPARNVLFITLDQWRGDCLSALGHPVVETPTLDALARRALRASDEESAERTRERLFNGLDHWIARRKHLADLRRALVYERVTDDAQFGALMMSAESARALAGGRDVPPFVVANSMREVQPEINLLVSPIPSNLVYVAPPGAPQWEFPKESS